VQTMGGCRLNTVCCLVEASEDAPSLAHQFQTALGARVVVCRADDFTH
jgi:hypothetical protein